MKILCVAFSESVHVARWLNCLNDQNWDIHLFPSIDSSIIHPLLKDVTVYHSVYAYDRYEKPNSNCRERGLRIRTPILRSYRKKIAFKLKSVLRIYRPNYRVDQLVKVIRRLQPDIIHSIELQHAGYLTVEAKKRTVEPFPPWIISDYGNDLYLFGRLAEHQVPVKEVLTNVDYYTFECERDMHRAREMGFTGDVLAVLPNGSGVDMTCAAKLRQTGLTSERRTVVLKGYQHWSGRALCGLRAMALCADALQGYRVAIYSATNDVKVAAELLAQSTGLQIDIIPKCSHDEMLKLFGSSRVFMGLSISDAACTSMLEALAMGAFPIQSNTACTDEWFIDGETGFAVPPEDPEIIAAALRRALSDDVFVDNAAEKNARVAAERLDTAIIKPQIVNVYKEVIRREKTMSD